jgi:hypothetical protein
MRASYISYFLEIAEEEQEKCKELLKELKGPDGKYDPELVGPNIETTVAIEKSFMKVIIFLASYLEAYTAATYLGETETRKLDKLAAPDKWDVIPSLLTGGPLKIKPHFQGAFKSLIAERNRLMHHKSVDIRPFINRQSPPKAVPKELMNIWERIKLQDYFELSAYLVGALEQDIEEAQLHHFN